MDKSELEKQELEELIAADPSADIDTTGMTAGEKAAAEALQAEMRALDEIIARALAIDVPELSIPELPPVAEADNVVGISSKIAESNKPKLATPTWLAIAASVAIVAVFGARFLGSGPEYPSLAAEVIAHLDHEPGALRVTRTAVAERELASVVNSGGVEIDRGIGLITYAKSCVINGKRVPHLVMQGKSGPITLLLMPEESVDMATPVSGESINGVILPVGEGSIAIIGERDENLAELEEKVIDSVTWSI